MTSPEQKDRDVSSPREKQQELQRFISMLPAGPADDDVLETKLMEAIDENIDPLEALQDLFKRNQERSDSAYREILLNKFKKHIEAKGENGEDNTFITNAFRDRLIDLYDRGLIYGMNKEVYPSQGFALGSLIDDSYLYGIFDPVEGREIETLAYKKDIKRFSIRLKTMQEYSPDDYVSKYWLESIKQNGDMLKNWRNEFIQRYHDEP